jgi:hypothetical protein
MIRTTGLWKVDPSVLDAKLYSQADERFRALLLWFMRFDRERNRWPQINAYERQLQPITTTLVGMNVAVFAAMVLTGVSR